MFLFGGSSRYLGRDGVYVARNFCGCPAWRIQRGCKCEKVSRDNKENRTSRESLGNTSVWAARDKGLS